MPKPTRRTRPDPADSILRAYSASARMNEYLVERLHPAVWRATPEVSPEFPLSASAERGSGGEGRSRRSARRVAGSAVRGIRTIAAIFVHMHNCGLVYLERTDPLVKVPKELNRFRATPRETARSFAAKRTAVLRIVGDALPDDRRIVGSPHHATNFLLYYMAHDNHHRGQILLQARLLGYPVDWRTMAGLWDWSKRAKE